MNQRIQSVSASRELSQLAAQVSSLRHPADPSRVGATDRRILCADGRWHRISELQRDEREFSHTLLVPSDTP